MIRNLSNKKPLTTTISLTDIFVTGGIGDVLTLTSFLDVAHVQRVYFATRAEVHLRDLFAKLCPDAQLITLFDRWTANVTAFYSLPEFIRSTGDRRAEHAADWSIMTVFARFESYRRPPWLDIDVDLRRFKLPNEYAVLQPFSTDKRDPHRDFTSAELQAVVKQARLPFVLLNIGDDRLPLAVEYNLANQTSLSESIAITARAAAYIGIDTAMSVVACAALPPTRIAIKSINPHYYRHARWYCAPQSVSVAKDQAWII